jgi:DNA-binding CsgD family transcriptional regulator
MVHSGLLHIFRRNVIGLYIVYLVIAVGLVIIYLMLEPYLTFSLRNKAPLAFVPGAETAFPSEILEINNEKPWRETLQANAFEPLSDGELDIAGFIMLGYKPGDIAKETRYTLNTVKSYRKELYSKLQIHETRELFAKAMSNE